MSDLPEHQQAKSQPPPSGIAPQPVPPPPPPQALPPSTPPQPIPCAASPQPAGPQAPGATNLDAEERARRIALATRERPWWRSSVWTLLLTMAGLVGVGLVAAVILDSRRRLQIGPLDTQTVDELTLLELEIPVRAGGVTEDTLQFSLENAPEGAAIDPATGRFCWQPTEKQGPDTYEMIVRVASSGSVELEDRKRLRVVVREVNQAPIIEPIDDRTVDWDSKLTLTVAAKDPDQPRRALRYSLADDAPPGAEIDPRGGRLQWDLRQAQPGQQYKLTVCVQEDAEDGLASTRTFTVRVGPLGGLIGRLAAELREAGAEVRVADEPFAVPLSGRPLPLSVDREPVGALEYATPDAAAQDVARAATRLVEAYGKTGTGRPRASVFRKDALVAVYAGEDAGVLGHLTARLGKPVPLVKDEPAPVAKPKEPPPPDPAAYGDDVLLALCQKKKLFSPSEYRTIRGVFAGRFERLYEQQIRQAYGADYQEMTAWLDEHRDIKEELYAAIDPAHDKISAALGLFNQIRKEFPRQIVPYANLAIAVAVVWDDQRGVYDYTGHQRRTRSKLPDARPGAIENFKYVVDAERFVQGRGQFLPWEFLTNVVNHRTPVAERQWALLNYLPKRVMVGKCYGDVPYDNGMLDSGGKVVRLEGKDYTLPNLRQFGGVCAMQADFAARVGKSLGVPAAYVGGTAKSGEGHAWVMWVELKGVSRTSIAFTLESHGRYRGDRYYVGHLRDPQTGQAVTDRQLELRLHTVGMNPLAKRQADFLMAAFPMLRQKTEMDVLGQLGFLKQVIRLCPGNEAAWQSVARMSREGVLTKKHQKTMMTVLDGLFTTFARFPDFTWTVFDDLVALEDLPQQRAHLYGRLVTLYEAAGRPDLACEARLKYADYLVAENRQKEAIEGLAFTIKKFPDEGRYVPKMLDKLENICQGVEGAQQQLVLFYQQFLPTVPKTRGSRPSPYCIRMYERAIDRFQKAGQPQLAAACQAELQRLRGPNKP